MLNDLLDYAAERMESSVKVFKSDLASVRTGRANPAILDQVEVEYFGAPTSINQLAVVTVPEPRLIAIRPFSPSDIGLISKAIMQSDLGLNPSNDGKLIRLVIPQLNEERRRELSRQVNRRAEEARVSIRNIRRDVISDLRELQKEGDITEDDLRLGESRAQELTDDYIKQIDEICKNKIEEIMEV